MKQIFSFLLVIAVSFVLLLSSECSTPWSISGIPILLSANFESDAINAIPDRTLPGNPAGDIIMLNGIGPSVKIIQSEGNKWLEMSNTRTGNTGGDMSFRANSITYPARIFYSWRIKMMEGLLNGAITISLKDGAGNSNVEFRLEDSRIGGDGNTDFGYLFLMPTHELLGKLPIGQICDFTVDINHSTNKYSLTVTRPTFSDGTLILNDRPINSNSPAGAQTPNLVLKNRTDPPEFTTSGSLVNPTSGSVWFDQILIRGNR